MPQHFKPHGYHSVTPHFTVSGADAFIAFLEQAFEGKALNRSANTDGFVTHAEVQIGDAIVEVSDGNDRFPPRSNAIHLFVEQTDAAYRRALAAGAASLYEPADMPYGERSAGVADPFGNHWYIATFAKGEGQGYY